MAQKNGVSAEFGPQSEKLLRQSRQNFPFGHPDAVKFYTAVLKVLTASKIPFLIGGTYALHHYADIDRPTKDLDLFCKPGDYPRILKLFADKKYDVEILDERWLANVHTGRYNVDVIFGAPTGTWPINDDTIKKAPRRKVLGHMVRITPPEELIVSKVFRMNRKGFDGADVAHIILKKGKEIDWKLILSMMDHYWEILLIHILIFRFVYPSERELVPHWLLHELLDRLNHQIELPDQRKKLSRGAILSAHDFRVDIDKWGFYDITDYQKSEVSVG